MLSCPDMPPYMPPPPAAGRLIRMHHVEAAHFTGKDAVLKNHPAISERLRGFLMEWLMEVCATYFLSRQTFHSTVLLVDDYLSRHVNISKGDLQLLGAAALLCVSKSEEPLFPTVSQLVAATSYAYTSEDILAVEAYLVQSASWEVFPVSSADWLELLCCGLGAAYQSLAQYRSRADVASAGAAPSTAGPWTWNHAAVSNKICFDIGVLSKAWKRRTTLSSVLDESTSADASQRPRSRRRSVVEYPGWAWWTQVFNVLSWFEYPMNAGTLKNTEAQRLLQYGGCLWTRSNDSHAVAPALSAVTPLRAAQLRASTDVIADDHTPTPSGSGSPPPPALDTMASAETLPPSVGHSPFSDASGKGSDSRRGGRSLRGSVYPSGVGTGPGMSPPSLSFLPKPLFADSPQGPRSAADAEHSHSDATAAGDSGPSKRRRVEAPPQPPQGLWISLDDVSALSVGGVGVETSRVSGRTAPFREGGGLAFVPVECWLSAAWLCDVAALHVGAKRYTPRVLAAAALYLVSCNEQRQVLSQLLQQVAAPQPNLAIHGAAVASAPTNSKEHPYIAVACGYRGSPAEARSWSGGTGGKATPNAPEASSSDATGIWTGGRKSGVVTGTLAPRRRGNIQFGECLSLPAASEDPWTSAEAVEDRAEDEEAGGKEEEIVDDTAEEAARGLRYSSLPAHSSKFHEEMLHAVGWLSTTLRGVPHIPQVAESYKAKMKHRFPGWDGLFRQLHSLDVLPYLRDLLPK